MHLYDILQSSAQTHNRLQELQERLVTGKHVAVDLPASLPQGMKGCPQSAAVNFLQTPTTEVSLAAALPPVISFCS
jgi:hypothetical protein